MKTMIMLAVGAFAVYGFAKYFGINSLAEVRTKVVPRLVDLKNLVYS
jgi:hypothetical protein